MMVLNRYCLLFVGLGLVVAAPLGAYSSLAGVTVTRTFSEDPALPGQSVNVSITVEVGAIGADALRGFFITDHIPQGLGPSDGTLYIDGTGVTVLRESEAVGAIYPGCTTERWVLETPPDWAQDRALGASSTAVLTYGVTVPAAAQAGTLDWPGYTWVGMIDALGDAGDHYGYEDSVASLTIAAAGNDDDNDGMPNDWETAHGLNPGDGSDASGDADSDGLNNLQEYQRGTDPHQSDSDSDTMPDGWEVDNGLDPTTNDAALDGDGDGLLNSAEFQAGTQPGNSDSDGDGMADGWEVGYQLDPLVDDAQGDADQDGHSNLAEYQGGSDPTSSSSTPNQNQLLFDDFADGDDTSNPTWQQLSGSWAVVNGEYQQTQLADNRYSVVGDVGWTDYRVEARVKMAGQQGSGTGLMFRVVDEDNLYLFELRAGDANADIWKRSSGQWDNIGDHNMAAAVAADTWVQMAVEVEGDSIKAYVDDVLVFDLVDSGNDTGKVGLNAGDQAWFDDLLVSQPGAPVNQPPTAQVQAGTTSGTAPLEVDFTGTGSDTDGVVVGYAWDFGDGESATTADAVHTYTTAGSYVARLTVTDDRGDSGSATVSIMVFEDSSQSDGGGKSKSETADDLGNGCNCASQSRGPSLLFGLLLLAGLRRKRVQSA